MVRQDYWPLVTKSWRKHCSSQLIYYEYTGFVGFKLNYHIWICILYTTQNWLKTILCDNYIPVLYWQHLHILFILHGYFELCNSVALLMCLLFCRTIPLKFTHSSGLMMKHMTGGLKLFLLNVFFFWSHIS